MAVPGYSNPVPDYYREINHPPILQKIADLDDPLDFKRLNRTVGEVRSRNFCVDLGDEQAWCAFDLTADAFSALLKTDRPHELGTRWINVWAPHEQKDIIQTLAKHYDFSPRLLGIMCSTPLKPYPRSSETSKNSSSIFRFSHHAGPRKTMSGLFRDPEDHVLEKSDVSSIPPWDLLRGIDHYRLVNEVWHWSSVDWGRRYICLGYNSLHGVRAKLPHEAIEQDSSEDLPEGKRVWTWLLLCEDKTVISIHEDPFPFKNGNLDRRDEETLVAVRRNLANVFRQLSKAYDESQDNPISLLPIRKRVGNSDEETAHRSTDMPGLLFYCLFDDWYTTFSLVARREHQYSAELNRVRTEMLQTAKLAHVDRLHHIGRQLAVLKRVYQSYELIIDRVLEQQQASLASLKNSHILPDDQSASIEASHHSANQIREGESLLGVSLSSAARVRFERLKDRIHLYALSEIQECLDQKESLVMMNFNLIAIKESYSVERLTRITLLLAKVTILFMPVSLMTGYFSTELENVTFSLKSYWIWFAVILSVSIFALIAFGFFSGTMEGKMLYRPIGRRIVDSWRTVKERRSRKMVAEQ
ncbi:hypothetical protein W97_00596 [Coniosporium apollinis CBS 100218]|uniref:ADP-ribosylation factor n=1 Tax=Coniosporium apollinis (strain CBS 100218) TaxID=1168221 RepID=R7YHJ4_CONA1|nr:uncharacterized protein W97_00596 [Coniosporium apollinis CBS 100218]EON61382.1 hypothetical protein W97_00596 [Coniosporium apollinis CBS 100218]